MGETQSKNAAYPPVSAAYDLESTSSSRLLEASHRGHLDLVLKLLRRGKKINKVDEYGDTALHKAAACGHVEVVTALLKKHAELALVENLSGLTPFHLAAQFGKLECARLILDAHPKLINLPFAKNPSNFDYSLLERSGKIIWNISNFSRIEEKKVYSDVFQLGGSKWRLVLYPRGSKGDDNLSLYLEVANHDKLPDGWSHLVSFTFGIVNQLGGATRIVREVVAHRFYKTHTDLGFPQMVKKSTLYNRKNGLIQRDRLQVVLALKSLDTSTFGLEETCGSYTCRLNGLSKTKDQRLISNTFYIAGAPWALAVYPKGKQIAQTLSVYLKIIPPSIQPHYTSQSNNNTPTSENASETHDTTADTAATGAAQNANASQATPSHASSSSPAVNSSASNAASSSAAHSTTTTNTAAQTGLGQNSVFGASATSSGAPSSGTSGTSSSSSISSSTHPVTGTPGGVGPLGGASILSASSDPGVWSYVVNFRISLINQANGTKFTRSVDAKIFKHKCEDWGFPQFIKLSTLLNPDMGFLDDDALLLEVSLELVDCVRPSNAIPSRHLVTTLPSTPMLPATTLSGASTACQVLSTGPFSNQASLGSAGAASFAPNCTSTLVPVGAQGCSSFSTPLRKPFSARAYKSGVVWHVDVPIKNLRFTPLHWAVFSGSLEAVTELLARQADVEACDANGRTPLDWACYCGHYDLVKLLLAQNASGKVRDVENAKPIHKASYLGSPDIMQVLLNHFANLETDLAPLEKRKKASIGTGADAQDYSSLVLQKPQQRLQTATTTNNTQNAQPLTQTGNKVAEEREKEIDALLSASQDEGEASDESQDVVSSLKTETGALSGGTIPISSTGSAVAVPNQNRSVVSPAIGSPPRALSPSDSPTLFNVNQNQSTDQTETLDQAHTVTTQISHTSPGSPTLPVGRFSLEQRRKHVGEEAPISQPQTAGVPLPPPLLSIHTPLQLCLRAQKISLAELLVEDFDGNVNCVDAWGRTPLHYAAFLGDIHLLELFLSRSQAHLVNHRDKDGYTPLHKAIAKGYFDCVQVLLNFGADVGVCSRSGYTPFHFAVLLNELQCAKMILEFDRRRGTAPVPLRESIDGTRRASDVVESDFPVLLPPERKKVTVSISDTIQLVRNDRIERLERGETAAATSHPASSTSPRHNASSSAVASPAATSNAANAGANNSTGHTATTGATFGAPSGALKRSQDRVPIGILHHPPGSEAALARQLQQMKRLRSASGNGSSDEELFEMKDALTSSPAGTLSSSSSGAAPSLANSSSGTVATGSVATTGTTTQTANATQKVAPRRRSVNFQGDNSVVRIKPHQAPSGTDSNPTTSATATSAPPGDSAAPAEENAHHADASSTTATSHLHLDSQSHRTRFETHESVLGHDLQEDEGDEIVFRKPRSYKAKNSTKNNGDDAEDAEFAATKSADTDDEFEEIDETTDHTQGPPATALLRSIGKPAHGATSELLEHTDSEKNRSRKRSFTTGTLSSRLTSSSPSQQSRARVVAKRSVLSDGDDDDLKSDDDDEEERDLSFAFASSRKFNSFSAGEAENDDGGEEDYLEDDNDEPEESSESFSAFHPPVTISSHGTAVERMREKEAIAEARGRSRARLRDVEPQSSSARGPSSLHRTRSSSPVLPYNHDQSIQRVPASLTQHRDSLDIPRKTDDPASETSSTGQSITSSTRKSLFRNNRSISTGTMSADISGGATLPTATSTGSQSPPPSHVSETTSKPRSGKLSGLLKAISGRVLDSSSTSSASAATTSSSTTTSHISPQLNQQQSTHSEGVKLKRARVRRASSSSSLEYSRSAVIQRKSIGNTASVLEKNAGASTASSQVGTVSSSSAVPKDEPSDASQSSFAPANGSSSNSGAHLSGTLANANGSNTHGAVPLTSSAPVNQTTATSTSTSSLTNSGQSAIISKKSNRKSRSPPPSGRRPKSGSITTSERDLTLLTSPRAHSPRHPLAHSVQFSPQSTSKDGETSTTSPPLPSGGNGESNTPISPSSSAATVSPTTRHAKSSSDGAAIDTKSLELRRPSDKSSIDKSSDKPSSDKLSDRYVEKPGKDRASEASSEKLSSSSSRKSSASKSHGHSNDLKVSINFNAISGTQGAPLPTSPSPISSAIPVSPRSHVVYPPAYSVQEMLCVPDANGWLPLHTSVKQGNLKMTQYLLEKGASVFELIRIGSLTTIGENTATMSVLDLAIQNQDATLVQVLLQCGAPIMDVGVAMPNTSMPVSSSSNPFGSHFGTSSGFAPLSSPTSVQSSTSPPNMSFMPLSTSPTANLPSALPSGWPISNLPLSSVPSAFSTSFAATSASSPTSTPSYAFPLGSALQTFITQKLFSRAHSALDCVPQIPASTFVGDLRALLNNAQFYDVVFTVEGKQVYGWKGLLATRCEVFRAMFTGALREASDREITITDVSYASFYRIIEFIYTDSVSAEKMNLEDALQLLAASNRYMLERLKRIVERWLLSQLSDANVTAIFHAADLYQAHHLRDACLLHLATRLPRISASGSADPFELVNSDTFRAVLLDMLKQYQLQQTQQLQILQQQQILLFPSPHTPNTPNTHRNQEDDSS